LQTCFYLGSVVFVWYLFKSHASSNSHNIAHSFNINALDTKVCLSISALFTCYFKNHQLDRSYGLRRVSGGNRKHTN
jgi:hypothetical protein